MPEAHQQNAEHKRSIREYLTELTTQMARLAKEITEVLINHVHR
jgi:phenylpyruvate tautomerase PptA (4-oxalocrotonate tautomerase family)